jgi:hypothetical protein
MGAGLAILLRPPRGESSGKTRGMPKQFLFWAVLCWAFGAVWAHAVAAPAWDPAIFRVAAVPVQIAGIDANAAKEQARDQARQMAAMILLQRLTPKAFHPQWQNTGKLPLARWIQSTAIRKERSGRESYAAEFDFQFRPEAVSAYLQSRNIPAVTSPAPEILLLPVYDRGDAALLRDPQNLFWQAMQEILARQRYGLVPYRLPTEGMRLDAAALHSDEAAPILADILTQLGLERALVVTARFEAQTDLLGTIATVQLAGQFYNRSGNPGEAMQWTHSGQPNQPLPEVFIDAGLALLQDMAENFKTQNLADGAVPPPSSEAIEVIMPLRGLGDWRNIERRIAAIPIAEKTELRAISRDLAQITMTLRGPAAEWTAQFRAYDFILRPGDGVWQLQSLR